MISNNVGHRGGHCTTTHYRELRTKNTQQSVHKLKNKAKKNKEKRYKKKETFVFRNKNEIFYATNVNNKTKIL